MSILITGGAGFIGTHLTERLLSGTAEQILLLDNYNEYYDSGLKRQNSDTFRDEPRVQSIEGDFCDPTFCLHLFEEHRPQYVIHLGATPGVARSVEHPLPYVENNVAGTTALLEAARRFPVKRFLFGSSSTVYGVGVEPPFREDGPLGVPASPYGASKRAAELMGLTYHRLFGIPFTSLRFFNAYGPRLRPDLSLNIFTRKILTGEPITVYGDGSVLRDFTHVSDICSGILAALSAPNIAGECINLGHNEPVEVRKLIALIEQVAGTKAVIQYRPPREGDMPLTCADLAKAQRLLGYRPQISIEQGVAEYVDWMRKQGTREKGKGKREKGKT